MWSVVWLSPTLVLDSGPRAAPAALRAPQEMEVSRAPSAGSKSLSSNFLTQVAVLTPRL